VRGHEDQVNRTLSFGHQDAFGGRTKSDIAPHMQIGMTAENRSSDALKIAEPCLANIAHLLVNK
jgi:hypothetical protein